MSVNVPCSLSSFGNLLTGLSNSSLSPFCIREYRREFIRGKNPHWICFTVAHMQGEVCILPHPVPYELCMPHKRLSRLNSPADTNQGHWFPKLQWSSRLGHIWCHSPLVYFSLQDWVTNCRISPQGSRSFWWIEVRNCLWFAGAVNPGLVKSLKHTREDFGCIYTTGIDASFQFFFLISTFFDIHFTSYFLSGPYLIPVFTWFRQKSLYKLLLSEASA